MAERFEKPKATVSEADGGGKQVAFSPAMQNKCFLCSLEIGEADPRQFYEKNGALMLAHSGCLHRFQALGETWPTEPEPEKLAELVEYGEDSQRVKYGLASLTFSAHHLTLLGQKAIAEKGLKAVIPDLIAALRAIEANLG